MLSFALVLIVGLGSIGLYLTAYIYPEINRKTDVWWSGIGLFYALILLVYRKPVGLLLGHTASVILLVWLSYQALQRRWAMVEANPPQPEAGTLSAQARDVLDQVVGKITGVDWQGLWKKMGTQADDGTSEKSILPPTLKQRLDFSGFGEKLKGMTGGKDTTEDTASPPAEPRSSDKAETSVPLAEPPSSGVKPGAKVQPPSSEVPKVPAPLPVEPVPPIEEVAPVIEQPSSSAETPIPNPIDKDQKVDEQPVVEVTAEPVDQPEAKKAELKAELDQVISDLSTDGKDVGQNAAPNLPQPPDPLG